MQSAADSGYTAASAANVHTCVKIGGRGCRNTIGLTPAAVCASRPLDQQTISHRLASAALQINVEIWSLQVKLCLQKQEVPKNSERCCPTPYDWGWLTSKNTPSRHYDMLPRRISSLVVKRYQLKSENGASRVTHFTVTQSHCRNRHGSIGYL